MHPRCLLTVFVLFLLLLDGAARAAQQATFTFDQAAHCESIGSWDAYAADITTTKPNPAMADARKIASIVNVAPITCGPGIRTATEVTGLGFGNKRFWLRPISNASPPVVGDPSNSVDRVFPLAGTSLLDVGP
jgi:hypothetical protein